jgi:Bacterial PH domain
MRAKFRSKVDSRLRIVGFAMPCVAIIAIGTTARHGAGMLLLPAVVTGLVAAVVVWIVLSTYYEFTRDFLVAHSGPFSWRIPLKDISTVRESHSVRSGPALSMDRLEVAWGGNHVLLISPEDKTGFLAVLYRQAPHLAAFEADARRE